MFKINHNKNRFLMVALLCFVLGGAFLFSIDMAVAQDAPSQYGQEYVDETGLAKGDPRVIAANIIRVALGFLALVAVSIIIYGGWLYMTSEGNEEQIGKAKDTLKNAAIGLVIILSAFIIVSWIIGLLTGAGGRQRFPGGSVDFQRGFGVIGSCIVESVYPENMQTDVPRNTSIIITFKEAMDPSTVCDVAAGDEARCMGEDLLTDNVKIFKQDQKDGCIYGGGGVCELAGARVYSNDNKTFAFIPKEYLGSSLVEMWYEVYIDNDVLIKATGAGAFDDCRADYMNWQFEVSTILDLTPPQVKNVFPPADNWQDATYSTGEVAPATGGIRVDNQPLVDKASGASTPSPIGASEAAKIEGNYSCLIDGDITVSIRNDNNSASITGVDNASVIIEINKDNPNFQYLNLGCGLTLLPTDGTFTAGNSWTIDVVATTKADVLIVGGASYKFVENSTTNPSMIQVADDLPTTISNIAAKVNAGSAVTAVVSGNNILLTAAKAGSSGNEINLSFGASDAIIITKTMSGGSDQQSGVTKNGRRDQPKNVVVQVNFNEPVMPIMVSGPADEVKDYIRVVNGAVGAKTAGEACANNKECLSFQCSSAGVCEGDYLNGEFFISNLYRTVEFLNTSNQCGTNNCGGKIYCLPEESNIKVELIAGKLLGCNNQEECLLRAPFTTCGRLANNDSVCQDDRQKNYPASQMLTGVADVCLNSLDGDKDTYAEGPQPQSGWPAFNENDLLGLCAGNVCTKENQSSICGAANCDGAPLLQTLQSSQGDDYQWSFFTSNILETDPPFISVDNGGTDPEISEGNVSLTKPIVASFNKILMSSTLRTGNTFIYDPLNELEVEHKYINLWNFTSTPLGFWIVKEDKYLGIPDGEFDYTQAQIRHSMLFDMEAYRAQLGSGIYDIYQNCYLPCAGPGCEGASRDLPSCCNGVAEPGSTCP